MDYTHHAKVGQAQIRFALEMCGDNVSYVGHWDTSRKIAIHVLGDLELGLRNDSLGLRGGR